MEKQWVWVDFLILTDSKGMHRVVMSDGFAGRAALTEGTKS